MATVQLILLEPNDRKQVDLASRVSGQVLGWQQGTVTPDWFADQLRADPIQQPFAVPARVQRERQLRTFATSLKVNALIFIARWAWTRSQ